MKSVLVALVLVGCADEPSPPPEFELSVHQWIDDSVTSISVDGLDHAIVIEGPGKTLELTRTYPDYATARASASITIELYSGTAIRRMGTQQPGTCAHTCPPMLCTPIDELRAERLRLRRDTDPVPFDAEKMDCVFDDQTIYGIE